MSTIDKGARRPKIFELVTKIPDVPYYNDLCCTHLKILARYYYPSPPAIALNKCYIFPVLLNIY
ncbi:hypothetical protein [Microseira wollei]|uniref:hypothetical protein n=1 Tax=Microseira wollei TaxID=467598 RepID=UPI001CFDF1BE|nr:hypothetical protein [Microseira wollei]